MVRNNATQKSGATGGHKSGVTIQGVLVAVNGFNRCDVLCDNGAYEVDVPSSDIHVLDLVKTSIKY